VGLKKYGLFMYATSNNLSIHFLYEVSHNDFSFLLLITSVKSLFDTEGFLFAHFFDAIF